MTDNYGVFATENSGPYSVDLDLYELVTIQMALFVYANAVDGGLVPDPGDEFWEKLMTPLGDKLDELTTTILPPELKDSQS